MRNEAFKMTLYRIAKTPKIRSAHNRETWQRLETLLGTDSATKEELISYCKDHNHSTSGYGFIDYCIKNEWLIELRGKNPKTEGESKKISTVKASWKLSGTGVYMAYPTSENLKPIYRGLKTKVNSSHTKIGITTNSFATRGAEYARTFDGEIVFLPLAEISSDLLKKMEVRIVSALSSRFSKVGSAKEWFNTNDHELVSQIVLKVISEYSA